MVYSFNSRIRYSETDNKGRLTFPALMDYFQDTSTFHGEDNGLSIEHLYENDLAWMLGSWQVRIFKTAELNDHVKLSTWVYKFRHCLGYRHYSMHNEDGTLCAIADSQFILMNFSKMTPATIDKTFFEGYTLEPERRVDLKLPRKIYSAEEETPFEPFAVPQYMIDTNGHVNNVQYIKTAMAYLPKEFEFNCFRCDYKKQAHAGDIFRPAVSKLTDGYQVKIYDTDNTLFFIGEWTYDSEQSGEQYAIDR